MIRRATVTLLATAALYEAMARSGLFPAVLLPTLPKVGRTLLDLIGDGTMLRHASYTLARVMLGFALAIVVGEAIHFSEADFEGSGKDLYTRLSQRVMDAIAAIKLP